MRINVTLTKDLIIKGYKALWKLKPWEVHDRYTNFLLLDGRKGPFSSEPLLKEPFP